MNSIWAGLADQNRWSALDDDERRNVAREIAASLGAAFAPDEMLYGSLRLCAVQHLSTATSFVAIPGGTYEMGVRIEEGSELLRLSEPALKEAVRVQIGQAQPTHSCSVGAFLCARVPLLEQTAKNLLRDLDPRALRPEFSGTGPWVPAHLTAVETSRALKKTGFRLLNESEWEFVARELGIRTWIADAARSTDSALARVARALAEQPEYNDTRVLDDEANALGLWGLLFGEWVSDAWHETYVGAPGQAISWGASADPSVARAGSAAMWPWQDGLSWLLGHTAIRHRATNAGSVWGVRFAMNLPV